jgi:hypothetical protein
MNCPSPVTLRNLPALAALALAIGLSSGCTQGPDTTYGSSTGSSLNGTGTFAGLLRRQGHQVRSAYRLTDELAGWADVVVRFASLPGPPDREEADWYESWLESRTDRNLVYVVRDYDGEAEYWDMVIRQFTPATNPALRAEAEGRRDRASRWTSRLLEPTRNPPDASFWFAVDKPLAAPGTCKTLTGVWGRDIDPAEVRLPLHQPLASGQNHVLLAGDGHVLAIEWHIKDGGNVLILASGSFLLNLPLANPARRPLAEQTARWIGDRPRRIAFVNGSDPFGEPRGPASLIEWVTEDPTTCWVAVQLALFGLVACLARAPILGRPRPDPPADVDRPAAHAEAMGTLLERGRNSAAATELLAAYRRWRFPRAAHEPSQEPGRGIKKT